MTSYSHQLQVNFIGSLVDERLPNFLLQYQGAQTLFPYYFLVSHTKPSGLFSNFRECFYDTDFIKTLTEEGTKEWRLQKKSRRKFHRMNEAI